MCIAVPGKIISLEGDFAEVDILGNRVRVFVRLVPGVIVGDYVMVHAGYALQRVDEAEAQITLDLLKEMSADDA